MDPLWTDRDDGVSFAWWSTAGARGVAVDEDGDR
jgi:hypothetical protein